MHTVLKRARKFYISEKVLLHPDYKQVKLTPFQRAIPPACPRYPRAARSPHLPNCPTAEHWPEQALAETDICLSKVVAVFCPPTTEQPLLLHFHPQNEDMVTVAMGWQDVPPQQGVMSGSQATQGKSSLNWHQQLKQYLLLGIKRSPRAACGLFFLVSLGLAQSVPQAVKSSLHEYYNCRQLYCFT